jgi:predicted Zn-dependent peptidase
MTKKTNLISKALLFAFFVAAFVSAQAQKNYTYQTVADDPMHVRIYTLDNGLKVYMTVYKDAPRIQTLIAVKTGSKCDPPDNTGLSHYLEHLMFKGTDKYGTLDWAKEKPQLAKIDSMFEVYRKIKDTTLRRKTYHIIDSISGVASHYAIANEYDKMMSAIGAEGTNAHTSVEETVYEEDIPSNQIETWATVEGERFRNPVFRLFHTELEAVYEEKNIGLDRDDNKVEDSLLSGLFRKHPYGTQTTIGTVEHLKNPSLKAIEAYYKLKYVPNNMAICMSGDFDPDQAIKIIDAKFGSLAYKEVKPFIPPVEDPITKPIVKEALGPDAESVTIGFRFKGANTDDEDFVTIIDDILTNGNAGLIDLNLNQAQKVLHAGSYPEVMKDYSMHVFYGKPKKGQKLEEVKDLILSQIELVKKGDFPDWLIPAIINDLKLQEIKERENNWQRASEMAETFIESVPWEDHVKTIDRLSKITKQQIIDFANKNYKDNYVVVYKRTGEEKNINKVSKPAITPVAVNRDSQSEFLKDIISRKPAEINPVFVDYDKDIKKFKIEDSIQVLYNENKEDKTFLLYYILDMGSNNDKKLATAINYLQFIGTSKLTPAQVKEELYKAGCSFGVSSGDDRVYVYLSGLSENFEKGIQLFENLLADAQPNKEALDNMVSDILKQRSDNKLSKDKIFWYAMYDYGMFGQKNPYTNVLSEKELKELKPEELVAMIKGLNSYQHYVMYYGPQSTGDLKAMLNKYHKVPATLKPVPVEIQFTEQPAPPENKVFVVDYDMKQAEIIMLSKSEKYNKSNVTARWLFDEYFGGSMNSVVFQELRESKALAYNAWAGYSTPGRPDRSHYVEFFIGAQNDKLPDAMKGMFELLNNMPQSQKNFDASKEAIIQKIRSERITKEQILFDYINKKRVGVTYDLRKDVFTQVPNMKISDLLAFDQKYIKDKKFNILVIGKKDELDIKTLEKYGKVEYLKLSDIFGY